MPERFRVRAWCEDRNHEKFIRRLLPVLGIQLENVFPAPRGTGSAVSWVTARYPDICLKARATRNQVNLGFLVIVEGDSEGVEARVNQLHAEERDPNERIAILVPTWSIESWVWWLTGNEVDESKKYNREMRDNFPQLVDGAVLAWQRPRADEQRFVPSLSAGRKELERLRVAR
jgi:hypothetical protein